MSDNMRSDYLMAVGQGTKRLTLAGLTISGRLFAAVLAAMPTSADNPSGQPRPFIPVDVFFDEAIFTDFVDAQHLIFGKSCSMPKAVFQKGVIWNGTRFDSTLDLRKVRILGTGQASFTHVQIGGDARCMGIESTQMLNFFGANVKGNLDLRYCKLNGIWLSSASISKNLTAAEGSFSSTPEDSTTSTARLDGVTVHGKVDLSNAKLAHETTFGGYADMQPAQFDDSVSFRGCTFGDSTHGGRHLLQHLRFHDDVDFCGCSFFGRVSLAESVFMRRLVLSDIKIMSGREVWVDSNDVLFPPIELDLRQISLLQGALITRVNVRGTAEIECRVLDGDLDIEDLQATRSVRISRTSLDYFPAQIVGTEEVVFTRCQFNRGGVITCQTDKASFVECDARQPLTVASKSGLEPARLISFFGTNLEHFVLSGIDMTGTIFTGAVGLDRLRIEGAPRFLRAPAWFGSGRQVVQDEIILRALRSKRWRKLAVVTGDDEINTDYHRAAAVYRTLRKSREDSKDEPGGADFYYGEMEMRRMAAPIFSAERWLITVYWLSSGYALRAWRAFGGLLVTLGIASYLLHQFGFRVHATLSIARSGLLLGQISTVVANLPNNLTSTGVLIVILARLLLTTFLALAVLALRGRVKR